VRVARGLKLGIGIPLVLLGLVLAAGVGLALSLFGPDGRLSSPEVRGRSDGVAIVMEDIHIDGVPRAMDTFTQLQATAELDLTSPGGDVFVGIAPAAEARAYLKGAPIDVVTDVDVHGGPVELRTRSIRGRGDVAPPASQDFWIASTQGEHRISWTLVPGDWWLVVMNADGSRGVDVAGTASIDVPFLAGVMWGLLIVGVAMLAGGIALIVSATRAPRAQARAIPAPPATPAGGGAPPRPDPIA
jgi:hypothetical protein